MLDSSLDTFDCPIFLAQSDTTAGFLCADAQKLNIIKKRDKNQKILLALSDFRELKSRFRIPRFAKKMVRNAQKTSFVLPNGESFRVVQKPKFVKFANPNAKNATKSSNAQSSLQNRVLDSSFGLESGTKSAQKLKSSTDFATKHAEFLSHFGALYSTSANESGKSFDISWAVQNADIIVLDRFFEAKPSKIYKLGKNRAKILRH